MLDRDDPFQRFIVIRRADLSLIASRTHGEHTLDDIRAEAWLIAQRIAAKRGSRVDFDDADDQGLVLRWLQNEVVGYADKSLRFAVKLDRAWDRDDAESATDLIDRLLGASQRDDPAMQPGPDEELAAVRQLVSESFSQLAAYLILLVRCDWDLEALAIRLRLTAATVKRRIIDHVARTKCQPSLFDRIVAVDESFTPTVARWRVAWPPAVQDQEECGSLFGIEPSAA